jgi:hypothetical protein
MCEILSLNASNKPQMGGACSVFGGEESRMQSFGGETWGKESTWYTQA